MPRWQTCQADHRRVAQQAHRQCAVERDVVGHGDAAVLDVRPSAVAEDGWRYHHLGIPTTRALAAEKPDIVVVSTRPDLNVELIEKSLPETIMADCSHGNSMKKYQGQANVMRNVIDQYIAGNDALIGFMLESNLFEGNQKYSGDLKTLKYGVSITDQCSPWVTTERLLLSAAEKLVNSSNRGSSDRWVNTL